MTIAGPDYECLNAKIGSRFMVNDGGVWAKNRLLQPIDGSVKLPVHDKLTESNQSSTACFSRRQRIYLKTVHDEGLSPTIK